MVHDRDFGSNAKVSKVSATTMRPNCDQDFQQYQWSWWSHDHNIKTLLYGKERKENSESQNIMQSIFPFFFLFLKRFIDYIVLIETVCFFVTH